MVRRMRTLASLLEAAARRSASEVVLESDQPVVYTTTRGSEAESAVLARTELFDMIAAAVDNTHQVELAVGNPVQFTVDAGGSWSVFAEPSMEGMTVRATRAGQGLELGVDPGLGSRSSGRGAPQTGEVDFDFREDGGAPPPASAVDLPPLELLEPDFDAVSLDAPANMADSAAPFESGNWTLDEDEAFDLPPEPVHDDPPASEPLLSVDAPDGLAPRVPQPRRPTSEIGVPLDDDDEPFDPFAGGARRRRTLAPTLHAVQAAPPQAAPQAAPLAGGRPAAQAKTRRELSPAATPDADTRRELSPAATPDADTRRELSPASTPDADTRRELPSFSGSVAELATDIVAGSLVYVCEPGLAETLADAFAAPSVVVDDGLDQHEAWSRMRSMPPGAIAIVLREDPSALLGWILRRLEEGYRVFLETRARSPEGARRMLLGVAASERAERWLRDQRELVIEAGDSGPVLRRV